MPVFARNAAADLTAEERKQLVTLGTMLKTQFGAGL
jgi:hypothetical protein